MGAVSARETDGVRGERGRGGVVERQSVEGGEEILERDGVGLFWGIKGAGDEWRVLVLER